MWRKIQTAFAILISLLIIGPSMYALAGSGTITVKDASGSTQTYAVVTDGSGHYIAVSVLCDYSAGANCAAVDSSHQLAVAMADGANVTLGTEADAAWTSGSGTAIAILKNIANGVAGAIPAGTNVIGYTTNDPCTSAATKAQVAISQTANTKLISATTAKKNYICSIIFNASDAENISIVEGTGSTCGTSTAAILGSTTAANGMHFAANGGMARGNGNSWVMGGVGTAVDMCLFQSGSGTVAGVLTYVQQ